MTFSTILTERTNSVGRIILNRPEKLNALDSIMMQEICIAAQEMDASDDVSVIMISGSSRAFAAGADIAELLPFTFAEANRSDLFSGWSALSHIRTPLVAAVSGYALGGGCELAMICDVIIASESAKFGQPEVNLGIIPGIGGTQRLTRAVGKSTAMDMILTGRMLTAREALEYGLVARVYSEDEFESGVDSFCSEVAKKSQIACRIAKEAINASFETPLSEGLRLERKLVHSTFATNDQTEGMSAFLDKRDPEFENS